MLFPQKTHLPPLPAEINLTGQTILLTGATSGIGTEIARQLLILKVSTLVLPARNVEKGESVKQSFISDPDIMSANPSPDIQILPLDMESFASVCQFTTEFKKRFPQLNALILNAGVFQPSHGVTPDGFEKSVQINYLSNVLLQTQLLPVLESTAMATGKTTHITWTGSRSYKDSTLMSKRPFNDDKNVFDWCLELKKASLFDRYNNSKFFVYLFMQELKTKYHSEHVIINHFCPNAVKTSLTKSLPWYIQIFANISTSLNGRPLEEAGRIALNAALLAGPESHGQLLEDYQVTTPPDSIAKDEKRQQLQKTLWNQTLQLMRRNAQLPPWMVDLKE